MDSSLKNYKIINLFPPGWSFITGSPYLSTAILQGLLKYKGYNTLQKDLNKEFAEYCNCKIAEEEIVSSVNNFNKLNKLYFREENKLDSIAQEYNGSWNLQLGFSSNQYSSENSEHVRLSTLDKTPFDEFFSDKVIPMLNSENPELIGFSIVEQNQLVPSLRLVRLIREAGYKGKILLGGNLITRIKNDLKQNWLFDLVDYAIVFQGELPFLKLLDALKANISLENVPSLIWQKDGQIVENDQMMKSEQDANTIPCPDFDGLDLEKYWGVNYLPLVHLRGCYFGRCPFCPIPYAWGFGGFAGATTVEKLYSEMEMLYHQYGMSRFQMVDEAFTSASAIKLAELIRKNQAPFEWMIFARFEKKWGDTEIASNLYKGGLRKIHLGLEIITSENREALGKKDFTANVDGMLEVLHNEGIKVHLFCLFGFPGTTIADADRTVEFIIDKKKLIDSVDINPFVLYRHTSVDGVRKIDNPEEDWALRFDYERKEDKLTNYDIDRLADEYEKILWKEKFTLLHPLYRVYSPWMN